MRVRCEGPPALCAACPGRRWVGSGGGGSSGPRDPNLIYRLDLRLRYREGPDASAAALGEMPPKNPRDRAVRPQGNRSAFPPMIAPFEPRGPSGAAAGASWGRGVSAPLPFEPYAHAYRGPLSDTRPDTQPAGPSKTASAARWP
jgi:hypothetical protein